MAVSLNAIAAIRSATALPTAINRLFDEIGFRSVIRINRIFIDGFIHRKSVKSNFFLCFFSNLIVERIIAVYT